MNTENEDFICDTCRKIDFQDLLRNPRQVDAYIDKGERSPYIMRYTEDCAVCELLFQDKWFQDDDMELRSYSYLKNTFWAGEEVPGARDSVVLIIGVARSSVFQRLTYDGVFCRLTGDDRQGLYRAQPVGESWDSLKARTWLHTCVQSHHSACSRKTFSIPGMNLIDCEKLEIVAANKSSSWLALSYVWGNNYQAPATIEDTGFCEGSRVPVDMPGTIRDAISVTQQLGYRYLWVDEYCIDQNDEIHQKTQINKMDQIYRGADLTIVAAAGEHKGYGLPGVGSTKRRGIKAVCTGDVVIFSNGPDPAFEAANSKWFTRAW